MTLALHLTELYNYLNAIEKFLTNILESRIIAGGDAK